MATVTPDLATQAQIARVLFDCVADGRAITLEQEKQLCDWITGKGNFARWRDADIQETEFGGADDAALEE